MILLSSFNDYVKFVTQQFVSYMDQPKEERKARKVEKKANRPPLQSHLFGMIPLAISIFWKNQKERKIKDHK